MSDKHEHKEYDAVYSWPCVCAIGKNHAESERLPKSLQSNPQPDELEKRSGWDYKNLCPIHTYPLYNGRCFHCEPTTTEERATPAGDVEEQLSNILMALCARVERIPRGKTYGWSDEQKAIMALFTAPQPPVVEGEQNLFSIINKHVTDDSAVDGENAKYISFEHLADLHQDLYDYMAARQQSADEVRREALNAVPEQFRKEVEKIFPGVNNGLNADMTGHGAMDFVRAAVAALTQRGEGGGK